jgi:threonine aldolase
MNFASDNTAGISPQIMAAITQANSGFAASYGADPLTARLADMMRDIFETDVTVFPVATGTAANALALACLVRPYGAVLCYDEAHIATDECGAPEFYMGGAKLVTLPSDSGRITDGQVESAMARAVDGGVHHVLPEAVSITQATEWGTVYDPDQIGAIAESCRRHGLRLHMDGARFANALAHLGCTAAELTWKAGVDVLSFGATKNGALAAEAVIFFNPALAAGFERRRKRAGQLWSKQRFLSAQLAAYLQDGLWLANARHANLMARALADGLGGVPGVRLVHPVQANEVFAAISDPLIESLVAAGAVFYRWIAVPGEDRPVVRLVTSFATSPEEVATFVAHAARHAETVPSADAPALR